MKASSSAVYANFNFNYINDGFAEDFDISNSSTSFAANWSFDGADQYSYALSTNTSLNAEDITLPVAAESISLTGLTLENNTSYYFFIKAYNSTFNDNLIERSDGFFVNYIVNL